MSIQSSKKSFNNIANQLDESAENNWNVLLRGECGTGKTHMVLDVAKNKGYRLKYFSASTLDPFADLVGIPAPTNGKLKYLRSDDINEAEFMFFDELNRAHKRVMNAVFEIIQFKSLNGEILPNLKMVWAAVNPWDSDSYQTEKLDPALLDRFPIQIDIPYDVNANYFESKYDPASSIVCYEWWNSLSDSLKASCSPRRLDYITESIFNNMSLTYINPFDVKLPIKQLSDSISTARCSVKFSDIVKEKDKFKEILSSSKQKSIEFQDTVRVINSLNANQLANIIDVVFEMPNDYIVKILFRQMDNKEIRKELFRINPTILMEYNKKSMDILFA